MKRLIASLSVSACLLVPSVLFAADPHTVTLQKGQPGTNHGISCNTGSVGPGPGGSVNAVASPFNPAVEKNYAGEGTNPTAPGGTSNANRATAISQYDVACFQVP
jgi:hypothetical protein